MIVWEVSSAILILVALILRFLFRSKLSARARYALWAVVLLRLLLPFSIGQARISVSGALEKVSTRMEDSYLETPLNEVREFENIDAYDAYVTEHKTVSITGQPNSGQREVVETVIADEPVRAALPVTIRWTEVVRIVWLAGAAAVALWFVFVNLRFARSLRCGRKIVDVDKALPVYTASGLETPCLFGLLRPAVYLPPEVAEDETLSRYAVAHELTHCRHGDHIWAALRCLCLALHWWNPLVWAVAVLSRRDAELACDEATLEKLGASARTPYGEALIRMTVPDKAYLLRAATMMSGADLKERICMIARERKTVRAALIAVIALLLAAAVGLFLGGRAKKETVPTGTPWDWTSALTAGDIKAAEISGGGELSAAQIQELVRFLNAVEPGEVVLGRGLPSSNVLDVTSGVGYRLRWGGGVIELDFDDSAAAAEQYGPGVWEIHNDALYAFLNALEVSPPASATDLAAASEDWRQEYVDFFTDTVLPAQAEAHPGQPIYGVSLMDINFDGVPELMVWDWVASGAATGMLYKIDRSNVVPVSERVFSTNIVKGHLSEQPWPLEDLRAFLLVRAHGNGVYYWAVHDGNGQDDRAWGKYLILDAAGAEIASYDSTSKEDRTTAWNIFRAQYEVMDIDYSDFTLSVYTDGEIDAAAFSALMDRWQPVQVDLQAMSGLRPAYTAVSGGVSVPLTPIAQTETAADIPVEILSWLPIVFDEFGQPFEILQEGEATICNYLIHDAETGEALDYFRPSGLSPQTYVFQNAVPGRRYLITVGPVKEFGNYVFGAIYSGHVTDATPRVHATVPTFRNAEGTELYLNMPLMELNARLDTMLKYGQTYVLPQHALGVAAVLKTEESGMSWPVVQLGFSEGWAPSEGPGIGATTEEVRAYWGEPDVAAEPVNERTPTVNYLLYEFPAGTIEFTHRGDGIITQINLYARDDSLSDGGISGGSVTYLHGRESSQIEHFSCFGELFIMCMSRNNGPYRLAVTEADGTVTVLAEGKDAFQGTMPAPRIENGTLDVEVGDAWILEINWFPQQS